MHADLERHVAIVRLHLLQIGQRFWILRRTMKTERLQRLARHHPWADRGREHLGLEWSERYVFPLLDIARTPVVEDHEAKNHFLGLLLGEHFAHPRRLAHHHPHFELEVEPLAGPETRDLGGGRLQLSTRPPNLR